MGSERLMSCERDLLVCPTRNPGKEPEAIAVIGIPISLHRVLTARGPSNDAAFINLRKQTKAKQGYSGCHGPAYKS